MSFPVASLIATSTGAITSISVSKVIDSVIKHNMTPASKLDVVHMKIAGVTLGWVIGSVTSAYAVNAVETARRTAVQAKQMVKKETPEES